MYTEFPTVIMIAFWSNVNWAKALPLNAKQTNNNYDFWYINYVNLSVWANTRV